MSTPTSMQSAAATFAAEKNNAGALGSPHAQPDRLPAVLRDTVLPVIRFHVNKSGLPGVFGVSMLIMGLAFFMTANMQTRQELESLSSFGPSVNDRQHFTVPAESGLIDELPQVTQVAGILGVLVGIAGKTGVELVQGEYELVERKANLRELRIQLPIQGGYPRIRQFVNEALKAEPALALNRFSVQKGSVAESAIAAQIGFSLFLKDAT